MNNEQYDEELAKELENLAKIAAKQGLTPAEYLVQEAKKLVENKNKQLN